MEYRRTRYLIQHRESKRYIKGTLGLGEKVELTTDAWTAWGWKSPEDALYDLHNNRFMPEEKDAYRIVKVIDQREVNEDGTEGELL